MGGQEIALVREPVGIKQNSEKVRIFPKTTILEQREGFLFPLLKVHSLVLQGLKMTNQQVKINPHKKLK